jgi:hypothetical protein
VGGGESPSKRALREARGELAAVERTLLQHTGALAMGLDDVVGLEPPAPVAIHSRQQRGGPPPLPPAWQREAAAAAAGHAGLFLAAPWAWLALVSTAVSTQRRWLPPVRWAVAQALPRVLDALPPVRALGDDTSFGPSWWLRSPYVASRLLWPRDAWLRTTRSSMSRLVCSGHEMHG